MPYVEIPAHRIAYNVDGTKVGYNTSSDLNTGVTTWCTQTDLDNLNKENQVILTQTQGASNTYLYRSYYFFLTESKTIKGFFVRIGSTDNTSRETYMAVVLQGSDDSSDGVNGNWENATFTGKSFYYSNADTTGWRSQWLACSFSKPMKIIRVNLKMYIATNTTSTIYGALALYGNPAPTGGDYLSILNNDDTVKDRLLEFGDLEEGKNATQTFKLKNNGTKTANTISLSLSGQDVSEFSLSTNGSTFASTGSIASLAPGASATVYVKDTKPVGNVGPKQAIFKASVGSWT